MKKYKVTATMYVDLSTEIEARDEDHAWEIALATDGGDFVEDGQGDWNIDQVILIEGDGDETD